MGGVAFSRFAVVCGENCRHVCYRGQIFNTIVELFIELGNWSVKLR